MRGDENARDVVDRWKIFLTSRTRVGYKRMAVDETRREGRAVCSEVVEREHGEGDVLAVDANVHSGLRGEAVGGVDEEEEHGRRQIGQIGEEFSRLGVGKRGSRETAGDAEGNVKGARDELRREIYKGEIDRVRKAMEKEKQDCLVVSALDDVMWLMNVRGGDAECNPVCLSHVLVTEKEAFLFVDRDKVNEEVAKHLKDSGVEVMPYEEVGECLRGMAERGLKIWIDENKVSVNTYDEAMKGIKAGRRIKTAWDRPAKNGQK